MKLARANVSGILFLVGVALLAIGIAVPSSANSLFGVGLRVVAGLTFLAGVVYALIAIICGPLRFLALWFFLMNGFFVYSFVTTILIPAAGCGGVRFSTH